MICTSCSLPGSPFQKSFQSVRICSICIGQEIQTHKNHTDTNADWVLLIGNSHLQQTIWFLAVWLVCVSANRKISIFFANYVGIDSFCPTCSLWLALRSQDPMSKVSGVKGNWYCFKLDSTMKDSGRDSRRVWDSSSLEGDHFKVSVWTPGKFWHQRYKGEENRGWKRGNRRRGLAEREYSESWQWRNHLIG